jgi:hypothetical protein
MKEIQLTQGKVALVDDADFEWLSQWKWFALKTGPKWYAARYIYKPKSIIYLHREILGLVVGDKQQGDHRNGDTFDNQRHNLRNCTPSQNQQNSRKRLKASSQYKGVVRNSKQRRWRACITYNSKQIYIGQFINEHHAARAYDAKARELFGEFARLNFPVSA